VGLGVGAVMMALAVAGAIVVAVVR